MKQPHGRASGACARRGTTLVELLVSLPLALLIATAAALLLLRLSQTTRGQSSILSSTRELRHGTQVLNADLEAVGGLQLVIVSDSLLEFRGQLGVLRLCEASNPDLVVAAPATSNDLWLAAARRADVVRLWVSGAPADTPRMAEGTLADAPVALGPAACGADDISTVTRRWRLRLADSVPRLAAGTPVSVHRDVRYRHYRSGASWWLGRQTRDGGAWETIQPVIGPLQPPVARGVSFQARRASGAMVVIDGSTPDSIRAQIASLAVALSMPRRTVQRGGRTVDSTTFVVPLKADAYRRSR